MPRVEARSPSQEWTKPTSVETFTTNLMGIGQRLDSWLRLRARTPVENKYNEQDSLLRPVR